MARKYKSSRKYSYNSGANTKKIILIAVAVVLVIAAAVAAVLLLGGNDEPTEKATFSLQSPPNKTTYYVGESASWLGLKAKLVTAEGNIVILGPDSCIITGFDSSAPAQNQVITVKYEDYTTTFAVTILEKEQEGEQTPENGQFDGLSFKVKPKTQYKVGDWLDVQGAVLLLHYDNGATKEIPMTYDMVHNFTTAKPGTYTVTVLYIEDGHRSTLTYKITVTE